MDAKGVIVILLAFVAGLVGGLAFPDVLPEPGWRVTAVAAGLWWIEPIWVGSWWLLLAVLAVVGCILAVACYLQAQALDAALRYRRPVPKEELEADEPKRLATLRPPATTLPPAPAPEPRQARGRAQRHHEGDTA